jgi:membrane-bound ClpP family serine protease
MKRLSLFEWLVIIPWTPLVGWVLFFFLPWIWALPLYLAASIVTVFLAWKSWHAIRTPIVSGQEAMIDATAEALSEIQDDGQVGFRGEIWSARAIDGQKILPGEQVKIVGIEGLRLIVAKISPIS